MTIVYHGKIENLRRDIAAVKPRLDEQYRKVLGPVRAQRLAEVAGRTLKAESFFDKQEELNERLGMALRPGAPNKFMVATNDVDIDVNSSRTVKIRTAPAFYISEAAMPYSDSKTLLRSFVHEFDHFVWYALQRVPYLLTYGMICQRFKLDMKGSNTAEEWANKIAEEAGKNKEQPLEDRRSGMALAAYARVFTEQNEKTNGILDRMILGAIGITVNLEWRNRQRTYSVVEIPGRRGFGIPNGGDPFMNLSDQQVVERFLKWEEYGNMGAQTHEMAKFMERLKQTRVSRLSIIELEALEKPGRK
jgi:hypothetical protein